MAITISYSISASLIAAFLFITIWTQLKELKKALGSMGNMERQDPYSLDHVRGKNIRSYLPSLSFQPTTRFLLLVTPSCGSCYETMEEIMRRLTHGYKQDYLQCLLLNDSEEHIDFFLQRYAEAFHINVIDPSMIQKLQIKIFPCLFRIDDHGYIDEATIHIWRMEAYLKGGENDAEHVG